MNYTQAHTIIPFSVISLEEGVGGAAVAGVVTFLSSLFCTVCDKTSNLRLPDARLH
jgi:hypothetical protein